MQCYASARRPLGALSVATCADRRCGRGGVWRKGRLERGRRRHSSRLCGLLCEVSLRATLPAAAAALEMALGVAEKERAWLRCCARAQRPLD